MESVAQSLEDLYYEHRENLLGFCFRLMGDRQAAEDVTQEVFAAACERGDVEAGWLFTCARSRCIDRLRRRSVWQRVRLAIQTPEVSRGFEDRLVARDLGWTVLRKLSVKMRSLLLLRAYAGLSYEELAEVFETTPSAIGVMLSRARKKALKEMEKQG